MYRFPWRTVASVLMKRQMARVQIRLLAPTVVALVPVLLATPLTVAAQRAGKVYQVGHLSGSGKAASKSFIDAFQEGMRALGYVQGQNWVLDERYAEGKGERLASLAQELIHGNPDVLLVSTTPGNVAAKAATSTIPIVMVLIADPVGVGIVQSLARPGGNITGVTNIVAELAGKRLEILKEIVPTASRIAVLVNLDNPNAAPQMRSAEAGARSLGLELRPVLDLRSADDLERAFEAAARAGAAGAIRMIDPLVFILRKETAALAAKHRLPVIYPSREDVEAGGLVAYGTNLPEQYRQAATFVHKILRGAKPADLPVEQPLKFELAINLKTAKGLGLTIPQSLLYRADKVIK
ncbi:MAG: ABC transporter substrate-binding protein [Candidatus Binatota bacterium]